MQYMYLLKYIINLENKTILGKHYQEVGNQG